MIHKSQFLIAAPASDAGKTTITLALLRALQQRGHCVQPYKCGPDYIDTRHHSLAAQRPSINLDTFMASQAHVQQCYAHYLADADIGIAEGVMGLFDGAEKDRGSSAEIAKLLKLPVILVINAKAMAYSAAALIYGYKNFDPEVNVVGVIFNRVNSESHYQFLVDACEAVGVQALGYVPTNDQLAIPSRHLGLYTTDDIEHDKVINITAEHVAKTVDIDKLLACCHVPAPSAPPILKEKKAQLRISVAYDAAFKFTYHENLRRLKEYGEITFFSPLTDTTLPPTDFLYLAGGYPELYLQQLSDNTEMRHAIRTYCETGGCVYAECGGMMYLGEAIFDKTGQAHSMVNFLPLTTSMEKARLKLGYKQAQWQGCSVRGHEFHYSTATVTENLTIHQPFQNAKGQAVETDLYEKQNCLASYVHTYWGDNSAWLEYLLNHQS